MSIVFIYRNQGEDCVSAQTFMRTSSQNFVGVGWIFDAWTEEMVRN